MRIDVYEDYYLKEVAKAVGPQETVDREPLQIIVNEIMGYWLAGWDWISIEMLMSEKDYPTEDIEEAFMEAQKQVDEMSRSGPFGTIRNGQFVKLKNGMIGVVASKTTDTVAVRVPCIQDTVTVLPDQIDREGLKSLMQAHCLRRAAASILEELGKQDSKTISQVRYAKTNFQNVYSALVHDAANFKEHLDTVKQTIVAADVQKDERQCLLAYVDNQISSMHSIFSSLENTYEYTSDLAPGMKLAKELAESTENKYLEVFSYVGDTIENLKKRNAVLLNMLGRNDLSRIGFAYEAQLELDTVVEKWEKEYLPRLEAANFEIVETIQKDKSARLQAGLRSVLNN